MTETEQSPATDPQNDRTEQTGGMLFGHTLAAGFPSPADDFVEHRLDLSPDGIAQGDLLWGSPETEKKSQGLMLTLDAIRKRFGAEACQPGKAGIRAHKSWQMQRGHVSKRFNSRWDELPEVQ